MMQMLDGNGDNVNSALKESGMEASSVSREIMLVEDDHGVARALKKYLESKGYGASVFFTGKSALEHVAKTRPAAAVVDIHLPDLSGLVLIQQLRKVVGEEMPIVVLSGDVSMETINSLPHVGATYFFSKPVKAGMLLERLEELMGMGE
ncbi:MAG TPA: response regulator [Tepidisphaeraceae bacterium]|jgi:two-component system sensor histidine kinase RpfC|nr:response regulator [Tepidisphaeraceae bacterium]